MELEEETEHNEDVETLEEALALLDEQVQELDESKADSADLEGEKQALLSHISEVEENLDEKIKKISLTPGEKGEKGDKGKDGRDGKDGVNGKDGKQGPKGEKGEDGKDGKDVKIGDILSRLPDLGRGGSINRQLFINGVDPLLRYTDVNLKAGSNVTLTYQNNNTTQKVDITISATGGGGGSSRLIQTIATSQVAGSSAGVDYVYLCSGTLTLTMPTTVGNTNLYTVKNIGAGIVTVDTTGGEVIDGSPTAIMPVQFTSIDLISNNSGNWDIT